MTDFSLVTVCTEDYSMEYLRKLVKRLSQVTRFSFDAWCITDRPDQLPENVNPIDPQLPVSGWWNKVQVFDGKTMPSGWVLYMDLDIVIVKSFDHTLEKVLKTGKPDVIYAVSDAIGWMNNRFSTSFMLLQPKNHRGIWKAFKRKYKDITKQPGGDQVWIGRHQAPNVFYLDYEDLYLKANLKFHLGKKTPSGWVFPKEIDPEICMVDCGGRPKPHQIPFLPYIHENWTVL